MMNTAVLALGSKTLTYYTYCLNALSIEIRDILDILMTSETLGGSFCALRSLLDCELSPFFFEDEFPIFNFPL